MVAATEHPLLLITGGPGCGKTTVTKALVKTFLIAEKTIALCAPTGRAAQRMSQVCGHAASTIHRLLRFDPFTGRFLHGPDAPLEIDGDPVDLVVVDEASMVDIQLAKSLFAAIPKSAPETVPVRGVRRRNDHGLRYVRYATGDRPPADAPPNRNPGYAPDSLGLHGCSLGLHGMSQQ